MRFVRGLQVAWPLGTPMSGPAVWVCFVSRPSPSSGALGSPMRPAVPSPSWSFARIIGLAAVIGIGAGTALGMMDWGEESFEDVAERAAQRRMPGGSPASMAASVAPTPQSLSGIPPFPGVQPRRLIGEGNVGGSPVSVSWFATTQSLPAVLNFYADAFHKEGRKPVRQQFSKDLGYVAWLDEHFDAGIGAGVLHMVTVTKQGSQTMVFLSASRPDMAMASGPPSLPEGLVLPPQSTQPQTVNLGEDAQANRVVYFRNAELKPAQMMAFFEQQLKKLGFTVAPVKEQSNQVAVSGQKGSATVVVAAQTETTGSSVVITFARIPVSAGVTR
jgi:hypothetical protein